MNWITPDIGKRELLDQLTGNGGISVPNADIHLYTNNVTLSHTTVLADFTELSASWYTAQTLAGLSPATMDSMNRASSFANPMTWTNTGVTSVTLYGMFLTDSGGTRLGMAAQFDSAPITLAPGQSLTIVPEIQADSIF